MNAQEISRLVLYSAGGILGLYLVYHGIVVDPSPETVAIGLTMAGLNVTAGVNVNTSKVAAQHITDDIAPDELEFDETGVDAEVEDPFAGDEPGKYGG